MDTSLLVGLVAWLYVLGAAAFVMVLSWRAERVKSVKFNQCRTCGYDLRATPERCPECGCVPWR